MKPVDELIAEGAARRLEAAARAEVYLQARRGHLRSIACVCAAISAASYLLLLVALSERWPYLVLSPVPGLVAGVVIAAMGGGVLRGTIVNVPIQAVYLFGGLTAGAWRLRGEESFTSGGLLILLFVVIASWPIVGGLIGYVCDAFEREHLQI